MKIKNDIPFEVVIVVAFTAIAGAVLLLHGSSWMVLIVVGGALAGYGAVRLVQTLGSRNWRKTTGTIDSAEIGEYSLSESQYRRQTYYYPIIVFSFQLGARQIQSRNAAADLRSHWSPDKAEIESAMKQYEAGNTVTVYVNPRRPSHSVLWPGLSRYRRSHYLAILVGGILLFLVGCAVAMYS